jgi:DNA-binding NarL/FixJ family response regulator
VVSLALAGDQSPADDPLKKLTPRERQVAGLAGRGLRNRDIARALIITEGTARVHIEHILAKLDLHSRARLAAWAVQHQLPCSQRGSVAEMGDLYGCAGLNRDG